MLSTGDRRLAQYKYRRAELNSTTKPKYYSLLTKRGNQYYLGSRQVVFEEDIDHFISDYYDNINNPAALRGSLPVYKAIAAEYAGISRRDVERVLHNMENNQLFAPAPTVPVLRPQMPKGVGHIAADTAYIEHNKERLFTVLVAIDTFSKYLAARMVKIPDTHQRYSGKTVAAAMSDILDEFGKGAVSTVKTDNGTEFTSRDFNAVLDRRNIKHLYSIPHNPRSNSFAESAVKSLKVLIGKYLNSVNGQIINDHALQTIVDSYNHTYHSTIKTAPETVHYGGKQEKAEARANIKHRATKVVAKSAALYPSLKAGDNVRVHKRTESAWRRYTKLKSRIYETQWSEEIFTVTMVTAPKPGVSSHYYLSLHGTKIDHPFLRPDLQKVNTPALVRNLPRGHYVVDKVIDSRTTNGRKEYKVLWAGWPADTASWVPGSQSFALRIKEYEDRHR